MDLEVLVMSRVPLVVLGDNLLHCWCYKNLQLQLQDLQLLLRMVYHHLDEKTLLYHTNKQYHH